MVVKCRWNRAYLDELVPASGDNDGVLGVGAEAHAGDPLSVALVGDGELAVTEGVPQLDGAVTGTGDDLSVVGGEGNGEDIVGVADEGAGGVAGGQLPQTESLVPGGRQSVGTVGGDHLYADKTSGQPKPFQRSFSNCTIQFHSVASSGFFVSVHSGGGKAYTVRDDVGVTLEAALGVTVGLLVAGEVPDDQGLVARCRQQHVGAIITHQSQKLASRKFNPRSG